jgi:phosphoribosylformylglycinamidine synthase subunit PurQ / glutaminase
MNIGVVTFPGSNCDADARHAVAIAGHCVVPLWHKQASLPAGLDAVILPGGFSYGDYLRTGAIARFSPIMESVVTFAHRGGFVLGICNGFQILCEAGLLPGALTRNRNLHFVCSDVHLRVENTDSVWTQTMAKGSIVRIPIAHGEGRYVCSEAELDALEQQQQVVFRYCSQHGAFSDATNPNGSARHIAGVRNSKGNVLGMMPHPERAVETLLGYGDGMQFFEFSTSSTHP